MGSRGTAPRRAVTNPVVSRRAHVSARDTEGPAYRSVAAEIEGMLARDELSPGDPLPNETDLAARFGVSRSTIRESIRLLEDSGYVDRVSPRKLVAAIPDARRLASRTARALYANGVTMREVWETTLALEPAAARHAAKRASDEQIAALAANVDAMKHAIERNEDLTELENEFHALIVEASNHKVMQIVLEPYKALLVPTIEELFGSFDAQSRVVTAHERIVEALERGDGEIAALWMTRHYLDFDRGCALAGVDLDQPFDVDALKRVP